MSMKKPCHPGDFIKTEIVEALGLDARAAAKHLRVRQADLSALLNGNRRLKAEMALRMEKAFGVSMDLLMNMQRIYDIAQARKHEKKIKVRRFRARACATSRE